ncbi:4'-phosphopantetheinyl transferase superfamily protein [Flavobacterium sp. MC2016-06]|jgi:phosphopantetheinyl transferase (holo-ACP synthase)|uniref:4'-phosphopantetheinyl transferase family protein n=1 Tax=Flavobacterium sp. MC2016-06 TaxID=2676308 RepID=UPI0012BAB741|nr:4'-phosphopantetheinyl transferase superfamily protein [Flavobacterium sp. MC2016-06]MBU3860663.1 4'-phosphopantetheinyl transferase superfamily protein [Flavobacterium sp. MC2016-06]
MIGNDVVSIPQSRIESNWKRKGFLEKIFSDEEQNLISNAFDYETMVWLIWSMKEASYKIYNRQTKIRAYIPKKLNCKIVSQNDNYTLGKVLCMNSVFYTKSIFTESTIHTIAVTNLNDLESVIEIKKYNIIKDEFGIPYFNNEQNHLEEVSISNHGGIEKIVKIKTPINNG